MKKTRQFAIDLDISDILDTAIDILSEDTKQLEEFFESFEDEIKKYARDHLDMIDIDDAKEYVENNY